MKIKICALIMALLVMAGAVNVFAGEITIPVNNFKGITIDELQKIKLPERPTTYDDLKFHYINVYGQNSTAVAKCLVVDGDGSGIADFNKKLLEYANSRIVNTDGNSFVTGKMEWNVENRGQMAKVTCESGLFYFDKKTQREATEYEYNKATAQASQSITDYELAAGVANAKWVKLQGLMKNYDVPLFESVKNLGYKVDYRDRLGVIYIKKGKDLYTFNIGKDMYIKNSVSKFKLGKGPYIKGDVVYVPMTCLDTVFGEKDAIVDSLIEQLTVNS